MVSLDNAVLARYEHSGHRFELLVDPELVELFRTSPQDIELDDFLALDEIFEDARGGERHSETTIINTFGTLDIEVIAQRVLEKGTIQLTTLQRKKMTEEMRQKIIHTIHVQAVDPRTKSPHPKTRLELALEESKFSVDPFKRIDAQVKDAVARLKPLIPLSFETIRLALKVPSHSYGKTSQLLREYQQREEWLSDGSWACVIECPAAIKGDLISKLMKNSNEIEIKDMD